MAKLVCLEHGQSNGQPVIFIPGGDPLFIKEKKEALQINKSSADQ